MSIGKFSLIYVHAKNWDCDHDKYHVMIFSDGVGKSLSCPHHRQFLTYLVGCSLTSVAILAIRHFYFPSFSFGVNPKLHVAPYA